MQLLLNLTPTKVIGKIASNQERQHFGLEGYVCICSEQMGEA